jgi:hypothetical protein
MANVLSRCFAVGFALCSLFLHMTVLSAPDGSARSGMMWLVMVGTREGPAHGYRAGYFDGRYE